MRLLAAVLVAFISLSANASVKKKHEIKMIKAGVPYARDAGDNYGTALAVGRMSAMTMQVELVGLTMVDPNSITAVKRKVKGVIDISSTDTGDNDANEAALERLGFFFDTKIGKEIDDGITTLIPKVVTVAFKSEDVQVTQTGCMGADLEIPNQTTPTDPTQKECYIVRPTAIIKHSL